MRQKFLTVLSVLGLVLSSALSGMFIVRPNVARAYVSPGAPIGFVNDYADVLSSEDEQQIGEELQTFRDTTSNEIVVATVKNLGGDSIENFANELFREWGIGDAERDNGVLMLVAVEDRKVRIEVGYGLEGAITDLESGQIIDSLVLPAFREGNYAEGIRGAVGALKTASEGEFSAPVAKKQGSGGIMFDAIFYGFFIFVWLASFLARSKSWWAGGVLGGIIAIVVLFVSDSTLLKVLVASIAPPLGLFLDWLVSRNYKNSIAHGGNGGFFGTMGGFSGGSSRSSGGGFGGFSGGSSGGGGSSGSW